MNNNNSLANILMKLKDGQTLEPDNSGKIFTKMGGIIVTQCMDDYNWLKANVDTYFFNTYVGRIVYVSRSASTSESQIVTQTR
jgi:hypothetical protein